LLRSISVEESMSRFKDTNFQEGAFSFDSGTKASPIILFSLNSSIFGIFSVGVTSRPKKSISRSVGVFWLTCSNKTKDSKYGVSCLIL